MCASTYLLPSRFQLPRLFEAIEAWGEYGYVHAIRSNMRDPSGDWDY